MTKIAVVFPGVGYKKDRPLLYYSAKQAQKRGYEIIHIDFSGISWSKEKLKDRDFLLETLETCLTITESSLKGISGLKNGEVVFISKSIGTVVANAYAKKTGITARQICFSPLEMIEEYVISKGTVLFYGDADPYADHREIEKIATDKKIKTFTVHNGNHSLETGDVFTDIDNLKAMIKLVDDMIG